MFQESQAMPIRNASTANLLIDSQDRNNLQTTQSTDFTITKQSNILAGYFTRLGVVELVLKYSKPNISPEYNTDKLSITIGAQTEILTIDPGNYTVYNLFNNILKQLNGGSDLPVPNPALNLFPNVEFFFQGDPGQLNFTALLLPAGTPQDFKINDTPLARMIGFVIGEDGIPDYAIRRPNLIPPQLRYLDFVCTQITYQQGLKDASTSNYTRDILYRWVFAWDNVYELDLDGYPIYQGYLPFVQRRYLSFPKMVKWDTQQPIGQLSLQIYDADGAIVRVETQAFPVLEIGNLEYNLGLLVSEQ
jgi:hypothetical protein